MGDDRDPATNLDHPEDTRGIGLATAQRLAGEGHELVLGYVSDDAEADEARVLVE